MLTSVGRALCGTRFDQENTVIRNITTETFKSEVLAAPEPVLVDFYADWCGPCRTQGVLLELLSKELGMRVSVVKLNVDENPEMLQLFKISSIPTLMVFRGGKLAQRFTGLTSAQTLRDALSTETIA